MPFFTMPPKGSTRFCLVTLLVLCAVIISTITRLLLLIKTWPLVDASLITLSRIFAFGMFYDVINAGYFCIPLILFLWVFPERVYQKGIMRYFVGAGFYFSVFLLLFNAVSEWFFWDEFKSRFNFIAVDYLVYTTEVIGNIRQSYPLDLIVILVAAISFIIVYAYRDWLVPATPVRFKDRTLKVCVLLCFPILSFITVNNQYHRFSKNEYVNELAGNGMYELFSAYLNNELNYDQFYPRMNVRSALRQLREMTMTNEAQPVINDSLYIARGIRNPGMEKKLNVVLITVESLSAEFLDVFGNNKHLTPNLDSLSSHSLLFLRLYATGTRTVRGLEALSLSVPPTPGQSIVRRPGNEHLFTLAEVFNSKGYESKFIYGGYGYFDNMNYFFANNGYQVIDRTALKDSEIDYENVWGVADENLFTLAVREIDKTINNGKHVFAHIMTTSNHRPYTYPEGRIDIPSHTSREGAVKYTDYAIGQFIRQASRKPWFANTLFVIVADHCASSAGKTQIPIDKYHIPLLIYSPQNIAPQKIDRLMSQIDVGPTILGLLNFSYSSKFFGYDLFKLESGRERVFVSTYQNLGYVKGERMVVLSPKQGIEAFKVDWSNGEVRDADEDVEVTSEAIAFYQSASMAFRKGWMRHD